MENTIQPTMEAHKQTFAEYLKEQERLKTFYDYPVSD